MLKRRIVVFMRFMLISLVVLILIAVIHLAESWIHRDTIEVRAMDYYSPKINASLDGFKIAFLSDIHISNQAARERLERAVDLIRRQDVDVLLLGGDYTYGSEAQAEFAYRLLAEAEPGNGIYAVLGNHDLGAADIRLMEEYGIHCLENQGKQIAGGLYVGGVEDLWNDLPDIGRATADRAENDFVLLLSHNPDVVRDFDVTGVDLVLSGHTHGGLVNVFGLWSPAAPYVTKYGNRFIKGLVRDRTDVFISNGLGDTTYPRVFARRQVNIITLRAKKQGCSA